MVLKDWKKIGVMRWQTKDKLVEIGKIPEANSVINMYVVRVYNFKLQKSLSAKWIKGKLAALKYAKNYRSKH